MTPTAVEVGEQIAARLSASAVAHRDAQEVAARKAAQWRRLIVEAIDAGIPSGVVAELAGVSRSRVHAVVAAGGVLS